MTRILWTDPAIVDLESIRDYIARNSEVYADVLVLDIIEAVERLESFPESGRVVPEIDDINTREVIIGNYRVIYETEPGLVRIITLVHGARLFPGPR